MNTNIFYTPAETKEIGLIQKNNITTTYYYVVRAHFQKLLRYDTFLTIPQDLLNFTTPDIENLKIVLLHHAEIVVDRDYRISQWYNYLNELLATTALMSDYFSSEKDVCEVFQLAIHLIQELKRLGSLKPAS